jgi:hypothetical protein
MPKLFEIAADLQNLSDAISAADEAPEEMQTELEAVFAEMLAATLAERSEKLDNYAGLIQSLENSAALREAKAQPYLDEAARLKALAAADKARAQALKKRLQLFMELTGETKIESAYHKFSIVKNGGKLPLIVDDGVTIADIPSEFHRVDVSVDNSAVRAVLESGDTLEWARLGERGSSVRIK